MKTLCKVILKHFKGQSHESDNILSFLIIISNDKKIATYMNAYKVVTAKCKEVEMHQLPSTYRNMHLAEVILTDLIWKDITQQSMILWVLSHSITCAT